MVVVDEAFKTAGKKAGLEIWRIKAFRVLPLDKSEFGQFYAGDSYIVLSTREAEKKLVHDVHFWLGSDATEDEYGTAAIKTVELDDLLGGGPVQYREVQDHESSLFLSYFKNGIKYLKGGYESGFHHVEDPKFEPRLFQCKGKRNVRVRQVDMSKAALNLGDVFILDAGHDIFVWMPPESGRLERIKGVQQGASIRDQERSGRGQLHVLDSDWNTNVDFWGYLGGDPSGISASTDDLNFHAEYERTEKPSIKLLRVSDASGEMKIAKVGEGDLTNDMLDSKDAFILDAASGGIFVWIGKGCTMDERKKAMGWASTYLSEQGRPPWIQVIRILDTAEPAIFTQWFKTPPPNRPKFMPHLFQCSDESGKLMIEEISNFNQQDLDGDDVMILDAGAAIFVWIGKGANENEKKSALSIAQKYLSTDGMPRPNGAKLQSIEQGAEPSDFTKYFNSWDPDSAMQKRTVEGIKKLSLH